MAEVLQATFPTGKTAFPHPSRSSENDFSGPRWVLSGSECKHLRCERKLSCMKWEEINESPRLPLVKHGLTPVQWENEQQTPWGGEDKLREFMNVLWGSFADASFFNFINMTTLFPIIILIFPTPGCQTLGSRNFYIWKCFLWGRIVVIKPVNHYILLERKPKLMSFHYPSLLFYPFVSLKWLLKNIIKIYWGLGAIIDTEKIMKANPTEHQQ